MLDQNIRIIRTVCYLQMRMVSIKYQQEFILS